MCLGGKATVERANDPSTVDGQADDPEDLRRSWSPKKDRLNWTSRDGAPKLRSLLGSTASISFAVFNLNCLGKRLGMTWG